MIFLGVLEIIDVADRLVTTANTTAGAISDGEVLRAESMRSISISLLQSSCSQR
jgi:hypothetical protein